MESIIRPPIGFAHRGGKAHAPENTLAAFQLALRLGATGLETDAWLTSDGVAVLDHDGRARRKAIRNVAASDLPAHVPTIGALYEACGTDFDLSVDVKDSAAAPDLIAAAREEGAVNRLWLCHHEFDQVAAWRELDPDVRLIDSTRLRRIKEGPERRAATLAASGVDGINMHASDWSGGLTTLFHRFNRVAFAWDAQQDRVLRTVLAMGVDAVYSDHVDRMTAALADFTR